MRLYSLLFFLATLFLILTISFIFREKVFQREESRQKKVLFLCVHNSFRSQIAEAYFTKYAKEKNLNWQASSAGFLKKDQVNEKAVTLMREEGIDISRKKPKLMTGEMLKKADKIIVLCKECQEMGLCLALPKDKDIEYWRLENPAEVELDEARKIRNLIKEKVLNLIEKLK